MGVLEGRWLAGVDDGEGHPGTGMSVVTGNWHIEEGLGEEVDGLCGSLWLEFHGALTFERRVGFVIGFPHVPSTETFGVLLNMIILDTPM